MPYRPPLVPYETFVADPPDLPVRSPGERGLSAVTRAELVTTDASGVSVKATTSDGGTLAIQIGAAGEGILRVRLSEAPDARGRAARALTLVRPEAHPATVTVAGPVVRVSAGAVTAELTLDPWHLRFVDPAGRVLLEENPGERDISGRMRTLPSDARWPMAPSRRTTRASPPPPTSASWASGRSSPRSTSAASAP
ncbi:hypothetical protein ACFQ1L_38880 [Phytohabitans flavus]|uniref:hypothetical protein n=1 Tax=Phytohabitans flavus TaxID=1076124 RepID=UPI003641F132